MGDTTGDGNDRGTDSGASIDGRTILRAAGASAVFGLGAGTAAADERAGASGSAGRRGTEHGRSRPTPNDLDPIFGYASAEPNPCAGDRDEDCFEAFAPPIRPSHEGAVHWEDVVTEHRIGT